MKSREIGKFKYLVVVENAGKNLSAYVPDLPGCISTGFTKEEIKQNIREAIALHIQGMIEDGQRPPSPEAYAIYEEFDFSK